MTKKQIKRLMNELMRAMKASIIPEVKYMLQEYQEENDIKFSTDEYYEVERSMFHFLSTQPVKSKEAKDNIATYLAMKLKRIAEERNAGPLNTL